VRQSKHSNVAADVHLMLHSMDGFEWVGWVGKHATSLASLHVATLQCRRVQNAHH